MWMPASRFGSRSLGLLIVAALALVVGPAAADETADRIAEVGASVNTSTKAEAVGTDLVALPAYAGLEAPVRATPPSRKGAREKSIEIANVLSAGIEGAEASPVTRKAATTTKARAAKKKKKAS